MNRKNFYYKYPSIFVISLGTTHKPRSFNSITRMYIDIYPKYINVLTKKNNNIYDVLYYSKNYYY